jgi:hypothetical protein
VLPTKKHVCAAREHVHKVERCIRTIKKRARTICHSLHFSRFTKLMTRSIMNYATKWVNAFPSSVGISGHYSPANIIDGTTNPDCNRRRLPFGSYAMVYYKTSNTMSKRTSPCISLGESNELDEMYFMSLETGKRLHSRIWIALPMNDYVISQVNDLVEIERQPVMPGNMPIFEWAPDIVMESGQDPDDYVEQETVDNEPENVGVQVEDVESGGDNVVPESDGSTVCDEDGGGGIVIDELDIDEEMMPEVVEDDTVSVDEDKGMDENHYDESPSGGEGMEDGDDEVVGSTSEDEESSVHSSEYSFYDNNVLNDSDVTYEMERSESEDEDEDQ